MIVNGSEIKRQILSQFRSVAEFARTAEIDYNYLQHTLNGLHLYRESISALEKFGFKPKIKIRKRRR
jgi:hypothetical protein